MGFTIYFLLLICIFQYCVMNGIEKLLFHSVSTSTLRPNCKEFVTPNSCVGMPSGHAEIAVLVFFYFYQKKWISLPIAIFYIGLVCLQRVLFKHHTVLQTVVGCLFGFFYFVVYSKSTWFVLFFFVVYTNLLLFLVERSFTIPSWASQATLESIDKKRNVSYFVKLIGVISPSFQQRRPLMIRWDEVEQCLDKIIEHVKDKQIDTIVGIKTGGAIVADYVAKKMNLPLYKIKVSSNGCKEKNPWKYYFEAYVLNKQFDYTICEGADLYGKNILLLDESIGSGNTMKAALRYLSNNTVYPALIVSPTNEFYSVIQRELTPAVWPWGYDN